MLVQTAILIGFRIIRQDIRASTHSDYGSITLLMCEGQPGLQVKGTNGSWKDAQHIPGALVVNIGDALEVSNLGLISYHCQISCLYFICPSLHVCPLKLLLCYSSGQEEH